jgi:magnesium chelatase family protein
MLATVSSGALVGIRAKPVFVEVNTGELGDPRVILVGLPDAAVKESQDRVASAITNSGYRMPTTRTTINLAPGNLRKEGSLYDLPIAMGILASTYQIQPETLDGYMIAGELGLSGEIRPIRGALAMGMLARSLGKKGLILPKLSAEEAALVEGIHVYAVNSLSEVCRFLSGQFQLDPVDGAKSSFRQTPPAQNRIDFSEIKGQHGVRRAVEIAVAGGHNLLMIGPPGSGKSMIAKRISTIIPEPLIDEFLEILSIQSVAGITLNEEGRAFKRPFRSPHHTISDVGLLGGGNPPGPGEISLAHHGVLFLDELPEFRRSTLEVLRQPLEEGEVSISRSMGKVSFPCSMMLVAAMNPCPCGYLGDLRRECRCSPIAIEKYRARLSGPLLDRIDIHIEAPALSIEQLQQSKSGESSAVIQSRIQKARKRQSDRFSESSIHTNARMAHGQIKTHCAITPEQGKVLEKAMEDLSLSARAYDRILKVARTIADIEESERIEMPHLLEAIQYRSLDRNLFY